MNKYVNESTALLQFRHRTARHKKRMLYEDRDKQLLALQRERDVLYKQQHDLGWIELHPPVVRGWKRYFVLNNKVVKSKQAPFFEGILSKINTTQYSYRKDFKIKKRSGGKKVWVAQEQKLWQSSDSYFNDLKFTEAEKEYFEERMVQEKAKGKPYKIFVFTQPWRFVLRVRLNVITKTRVRDEMIESRIQEIDNYLKCNALRGRLAHLSRGHRYAWHEDPKVRDINPLKNKPLAAILNEYYVKEETAI